MKRKSLFKYHIFEQVRRPRSRSLHLCFMIVPSIILLMMAGLTGCHGGVFKKHNVQLDSLQRVCHEASDRFAYTTLDSLAKQYIHRADQADDKRHQAYAHFYQGVSCLFTNRMDSAIRELELTRNLATHIDNDTLQALALNAIGIHESTANNNLYLAQWYFTESLKHAKRCGYKKLEPTIYGNLCSIAQIQNDTTMIGYAYECYNYGVREQVPHIQFIGALHVCDLACIKGDLDTALTYGQRAIDLCKEFNLNDEAIAYVSLSNVMYKKGQLALADSYAQQAIDLAEINSNQMVLANAYNQKALICYRNGAYQESIDWLERELACGESLEVVKSQIYELLANNYKALGNEHKALECLTRAKELADSTNLSDRDHLMRERDMSFSIIEQQRQLEFNKQQLRNRSIIICGLVVLVLLLLYLVWTIWRNMRHRNQLYANIVRQHMEAIERENELTARATAQVVAQEAPDADTVAAAAAVVEENVQDDAAEKHDPSPKSMQIYNELCRLMEQERIYTDPQLNRESLAQRLGTNKTYMSSIISECSGGKNLSQFINHYRIQEAVRILSDKDHIDYPLKQLCLDLGFGSVSTFYKLFQDNVGMPPSTYRKSFINVIQTEQNQP